MLSLILLENSFQFNLKDYLQTRGTAMGTKMAVAFANIFMAKIEKEILRQSSIKPIFWKRFISMTSYQYGTQAETKSRRPITRTFKGNRKKVRVIGRSKKIAESKVKAVFTAQ